MIGQSIEVEEHPDYKKGDDGIHWPENGHNDGILMHRFVGGIIVEGKVCRVQTVMKEYLQANMSAREYAYDVAKIEVLDDMPNTSNGVAEATEGLQPLANIIKNLKSHTTQASLFCPNPQKRTIMSKNRANLSFIPPMI